MQPRKMSPPLKAKTNLSINDNPVDKSAPSHWEIAQSGELDCWRNMLPQLQSEEYWGHKKETWRRIARRLDIINIISNLDLDPDQIIRIADVGCGPAGIMCELPQLIMSAFNAHKHFNYYGIDPLMAKYLEFVPELINYPISWINGPGEELPNLLESPVHIIFSLNALDHAKSIEQCLSSFEKCLLPGGVAVISLNQHSSYFVSHIFSKFNIEKLHPFQLTKNMFIKLLYKCAPSLYLDKIICLDEDYRWLRERKWSHTPSDHKARSGPKSLINIFADLVGVRLTPRFAGDRSIFHHNAFVLRK